MATFPGGIVNPTDPLATDKLSSPSHSQEHQSHNAEIVAIETKIGTGSSTPTAGKVLRATGTGTSAWGQMALSTDVSAATSADLRGVLSDETGTGVAVFGTAPSISAPVITGGGTWTSGELIGGIVEANTFLDQNALPKSEVLPASHDYIVIEKLEIGSAFTFEIPSTSSVQIKAIPSYTHSHQDTSSGGLITPVAIYNPYKFSVYRNAAQNLTSAPGFTLIQCDTKLFDTGSNVDVATNKGRFTAPIAGFYWFTGRLSATSPGQFIATLFKNGSIYRRGVHIKFAADTAGSVVTELIQLAANDYVELFCYADSNVAVELGTGVSPSFSGFLVSAT